MRRRSPRRLLGVLAAVSVAFTLFASAPAASAADTTDTSATSATSATATSATGTSATRSADKSAQPLSTSTPVVFVHGYTGNASNWVTAMSVFRLNGWSSSNLFAYEYNSYGNNITNAQGLASYTRLDGATNNNVVCQTHIGYLADTIVLGEVARFIAS